MTTTYSAVETEDSLVEENETLSTVRKVKVDTRKKRQGHFFGDSPYDEYVHRAIYNFMISNNAIIELIEGVAKWNDELIEMEVRRAELPWPEDMEEVKLKLHNGYVFIKPGT